MKRWAALGKDTEFCPRLAPLPAARGTARFPVAVCKACPASREPLCSVLLESFRREGVDDALSPKQEVVMARFDAGRGARGRDRRVLNGIFRELRKGSPWRDLPERYGAHTALYIRFNRWAKAGIWVEVFQATA